MSMNTYDTIARTIKGGISFTIAKKYPSKESSPLELRYRFHNQRYERSIGVTVLSSEWNDKQECLHQNDDRQKKVQAIKDVMNGINRTLFSGKSISSDAIKAKLDEVIFHNRARPISSVKDSKSMRVGEVWKKFYDLSFTYKRGGSTYVSLFHNFVNQEQEEVVVPNSKHFEKWIRTQKPSTRGQVLIAILAKQVLGESWVKENGNPFTINDDKQYATVKVFLSSLDGGSIN
jgi:hypothetical protein